MPHTKWVDGGPIGRRYWGLPCTSVTNPGDDATRLNVAIRLIDENIVALDEALGAYARDRILDGKDERESAHCCLQAIHTLKEFREVLLALRPAT